MWFLPAKTAAFEIVSALGRRCAGPFCWWLPVLRVFGGDENSQPSEPHHVLLETVVLIGIILLAVLVAGLLIACVLSPKDGQPVDRK
jgi:hypothetical protein